MGRILFLAFLLVPLAELYVLIQVGSVIGALPTVGLVIFTAVLGATLIRAQGLATVARIRASMDRGEVPAVEILEGACLLVAGALLLTPGFVTDALGFLLLLPMLRRSMILGLLERGVIRSTKASADPGQGPRHGVRHGARRDPGQAPGHGSRQPPGPGKVIEGEFRRED